uniref:Innexin n=1 Tax=Hirudo verbana TaxID=311461 RepID=H9C4R3_9ANNE|nr:INX13 [Hirudo verbana]
MDKLVILLEKAPNTRDYNYYDLVDRISSRYSVVLLVLFAVLVSMNQYVRNPITCWTPDHFSGGHTKYATSLCWVKNTYYLPWNETVPREHEHEKKQMIPYYQWVPFILVAQAVMFYLPSLVWHSFNSRAGVDADNILAAAHTFSMTDKVETRDRTMKMLVQQLHRFLRSHNNDGKHNQRCCHCHCSTKRVGNYLVLIFLVSKLLYIANTVGQMFLLGKLLSTRYLTFGFDLTKRLFDNQDWTEAHDVAFPRVTICDFKVRGQDMINPHPYTIQCVLPVNMYNEKIYIFLWYWIIFVFALSVLSFVVWFLRCLVASDREKFVKNHIIEASEMQRRQDKQAIEMKMDKKPRKIGSQTKLPQTYSGTDSGSSLENIHLEADDMDKNIRRFSRSYLMQDGELILRLIAHNTNHVTTTEVINELYRNWIPYDKQRRDKLGPTKI